MLSLMREEGTADTVVPETLWHGPDSEAEWESLKMHTCGLTLREGAQSITKHSIWAGRAVQWSLGAPGIHRQPLVR